MSGETGNQRGISDSQGLSLLVVDTDPVLARAIGRTLSDDVAQVCLAENVQRAVEAMSERQFDALIVGFDDEQGRALLEAQASRQTIPEILVHARSLRSPAAEWVRERAVGEVLEKPAPVPVLLDWIKRIRAGRDAVPLPRNSGQLWGAERLLGESRGMAAVRELVRRVSGFSAVPVLVVGEPGTGRKLVASAIHEQGSADEPLVTVHCDSQGVEGMEVVLFGRDGGAGPPSLGALEAAGRGTVVLCEAFHIPRSVHPKLTRALETKRFAPVDSNREVPLRARVISTSPRLLRECDPPLRSDLAANLSGYNISVPPLRQRLGDIPVLVSHFVRELSSGTTGAFPTVTRGALELLGSRPWDGNVSELRSVVVLAFDLAGGGGLEEKHVRQVIAQAPVGYSPSAASGAIGNGAGPEPKCLVGEGRPFSSLEALERFVILGAFEESRGNLSRAARTLGVARSTLRDRLRRYGVPLNGRG